MLAHIIGWWGKAILIRNQPLLWVLSIGFELMEVSFFHFRNTSFVVSIFSLGWLSAFMSLKHMIIFVWSKQSCFYCRLNFMLVFSAYIPAHVTKLQWVLVGQYNSRHIDLQLVWWDFSTIFSWLGGVFYLFIFIFLRFPFMNNKDFCG